MESKTKYDILLEIATATPTAKTNLSPGKELSVGEGNANKLQVKNKEKSDLKWTGSSWEKVNPADAGEANPYWVRIESGNGWELGNRWVKVVGDTESGIKGKDEVISVLNILHSGMPISTDMNDSLIHDIIAKIENNRARRGATSSAIQWMVSEDGSKLILYATDAGAIRTLKSNLMEYSKKHAIEFKLADINGLAKSLQIIQKSINEVCNTSPSMTVEYAHRLGDSIQTCKKSNDFVIGLRSTTTNTKAMYSLLVNNKVLANMADERSNKDAFPNMLKRLMIIRKKMLEHFATDDINKNNQSTYRDILTALIDSSNPSDPDLAAAEANFGNKLRTIGITPEISSNKLYDELESKLSKYSKTVYDNEDEAEATAQALLLEAGKKYKLDLVSETWYKSYVNCVNGELANKLVSIRKSKEIELGNATMPGDVETTSPAANAGEKEVPSHSYYFLYDVKYQLPFNILVPIPLGVEKKKKAWHSILSRLGKAGYELLGYRPQSYINSIIDSYATTRDCKVMVPALLLKGSANLADTLLSKMVGHETWFSTNNKNRFQLSKWIREEMQTKAGEINPEVKKLESGLVNTPRSIANGWRTIFGKPKKEKPVAHIDTTNFDGSNLAPDRIKYAEHPEDKHSGKSGHYQISKDEKNMGKLTKEGAEGGPAMSGAVSAGDGFFQMPGSISSEGNPIAPTYTQTPFVNGEKTSVENSGSGDKFSGDINKKKDKKKKNNEWFDRLQELPDVKSFFDNWGE